MSARPHQSNAQPPPARGGARRLADLGVDVTALAEQVRLDLLANHGGGGDDDPDPDGGSDGGEDDDGQVDHFYFALCSGAWTLACTYWNHLRIIQDANTCRVWKEVKSHH